MTKVILCIALLAMSYIASADVNTFVLPLSATPDSREDFMLNNCQTTDGKLYYYDTVSSTNETKLVRVWNIKDQSQDAPLDLSAAAPVVQNFIDGLSKDTDVLSALECIGTDVYASIAYSDKTNAGTGLHLFLLTGSVVTTYTLPLTNQDLVDKKLYVGETCVTADGKFNYLDGDIVDNTPTLRTFDPLSKTNTSIDGTKTFAQYLKFMAQVGTPSVSTYIVQCIGNNAYVNIAYSNSSNSGVELLLIEDSDDIDTYSLPLANGSVPSDAIQYLSITCATADGKLHYIDDPDNKTVNMQEWNSKSNSVSDAASVTDAYNQVVTFLTNNKATSGNQLLQCIGNDVYENVAWSNSTTDAAIELFQLKRSSAGILTFSFGALFLALVALMF